MIKKRPFSYMLLLLGVILISINFVSAMNFTSPSNNSIVSGGRAGGRAVLNLTLIGGEGESVTGNFSCALYVGSAISANATWTRINISDGILAQDVHNNTVGAGLTSGSVRLINSSFASTIVEDANDYRFNATCVNNTDVIESIVNRPITIENTAPVSPSSLTPLDLSTQDLNDTLIFVSTVTGTQTTACSLHFVGINPGSTFYNMTHSGNLCSYNLGSTPENTYRWFVRATDGTNNTDSSIFTINLDLAENARSTGISPITGKVESLVQSNLGGIPIGAILGIFLVVILLYFAFIKK